MGRDRDRLVSPILVQPEQRPDPDPSHPGPRGAFRPEQPPPVVTFAAGEMDPSVRLRVIGLLVDHGSLTARVDELPVLLLTPHLHLDRELRHLFREQPDPLDEELDPGVSLVFAGQEQDRAEPVADQMPGLFERLLGRERLPRDGKLPREPAVDACGQAFVRQVQRCVHAHGLAEPRHRQAVRRSSEVLDPVGGGRRQQCCEVLERPLEWARLQRAIHEAG